jgi:hypothetical protein
MNFKLDSEAASNTLGGVLAIGVLIAIVAALITFIGWLLSLPFSVIVLLVIVGAVAFIAGRASA